MVIFSIIVLIIFILTTPHLINWMWRNILDDLIVLGIFISIIYTVTTAYALKYLIIWAYPLLVA